MIKKIALALLFLLIVIQFIRPEKNNSKNAVQENNIGNHYTVPESVKIILEQSCMDCHGNNSTYPWYNNIQPVAWWLSSHINDGKKHMNFDEFGTYKPKKQDHKMEEVIEMVKEKEMPLKSYTWLHDRANITDEQRTILINWAKETRSEITAKTGFVPEVKK